MRFKSPQLGAMGAVFTTLRALQFLSLVIIVSSTASFINDFASSQREVPDVLVGTIIVSSISAIYVAISYILYYDGVLSFFISAVLDSIVLVASIVVAATIGQPLPSLKCELLPESVSLTGLLAVFAGSETAAMRYESFLALIKADQGHCYMIKALWGVDIALIVLFTFSALVCVGLWHTLQRDHVPVASKDLEGH